MKQIYTDEMCLLYAVARYKQLNQTYYKQKHLKT